MLLGCKHNKVNLKSLFKLFRKANSCDRFSQEKSLFHFGEEKLTEPF
jgi:hypothetical protein